MNSRTTGPPSIHNASISRLSPDLLPLIFLNLGSTQIVHFRKVCSKWLDIIDNNKSLWRILDWKLVKDQSAQAVLEKFNEKSGSTLKEVSIGDENLFDRTYQRSVLTTILLQSRQTMESISLKLAYFEGLNSLEEQVLELVSMPNLRHLVLWDSYLLRFLPISRLLPLGLEQDRKLESDDSKLKVLWFFSRSFETEGFIDRLGLRPLESLVSFVDPHVLSYQQWYRIISEFSSTIIHLGMRTPDHESTESDQPPLLCPFLKVIEGFLPHGLPAWLISPNLQTIVFNESWDEGLLKLPTSIEELWFNIRRIYSWEDLLQVCPTLKILKLAELNSIRGESDYDSIKLMSNTIESKSNSTEFMCNSIVKLVKNREENVKKGIEIEGVKMTSLQKLVIPFQCFNCIQLDELRKLVKEVIDVDDHPKFIEIEY